MKYYVMITALMLAGCSDTVYPKYHKNAENQCKERGGYQFAVVDDMPSKTDIYTVHCNDGVVLKFRAEK